MARPQVDITAMNGGLGILPAGDFGNAAVLIASPIAPTAGYGTAFTIKSKSQAKAAFDQVGNEAVLDALNAFYDEAPSGSKLNVIALADTNTLTQLLDEDVAKKVLADGTVRLLSVIKFPAQEYTPNIEEGFDEDVHAAVIAGQALADTYFDKKQPFRLIIEGYAFDGDADTAKDYGQSSYRNVAICVGSIDDSTANATMLLLGRAVAIQPQQNVGRIKSGSIKTTETAVFKIGATLLDEYEDDDFDTLYDKRYIFPEKNLSAPGYVWTDDNMLTKPEDDYYSLSNGRVMDNAVRIAFDTYYQQLKDDVDVDENGRLSAAIEKGLETAIETDIDQRIGSQLSSDKDGSAAVEAFVNPDPVQYAPMYEDNGIPDPDFNLLRTNRVYIFVRCKPKGILKYINVFLGFTSN